MVADIKQGVPLRQAGRSGLYLSAIGIGMNQWGVPADGSDVYVDEEKGFNILDRALDLGVTHWDTASGYNGGGSERLVGNFFASRGRDVRDRVILSTKWAGPHGAGRGFLRKAVDASLRRLQTDYLDIFMLHNPCMDEKGRYRAPIDETWETLHNLVGQGKIHYLGISNAHGINLRDATESLERLSHGAQHDLAVVENVYNLIRRGQVGRGLWTDWRRGSTEEAFLDELETLGLGLIPFWGLCSGALSGRYRKSNLGQASGLLTRNEGFKHEYLEGRTLDAIEELALFADEKGVALAEVAIAWLLSKPQVASALVGVTKMDQLEDAVKGSSLILTEEEIARVESIGSQAETVEEYIKRISG